MTGKEKAIYLYGHSNPPEIPMAVKRARVDELMKNRKTLAKAEKLDLVRINEVNEAIDFWIDLV